MIKKDEGRADWLSKAPTPEKGKKILHESFECMWWWVGRALWDENMIPTTEASTKKYVEDGSEQMWQSELIWDFFEPEEKALPYQEEKPWNT